MITKLTLSNFKSIKKQTYKFTKFDLLVGRNNSGKSTILQALGIWQFCIDEFHRVKRRGERGIQVVLPNFSALPVPEFNLLWKDKTDRRYPVKDGKKRQEYILIEIDVSWVTPEREEHSFAVKLRYNSPQTIYAIPAEGWKKFRELEQKNLLPLMAYVPPFSGLEPSEEWRDDGPLRKQVGKAQPGSVLRNLLLRVCPPADRDEKGRIRKGYESSAEWKEIKAVVRRWFSVKLKEPQYERGIDTQIDCEYLQGNKSYDIIAGGSGFHQTLTLLAFLYGYKPTTILLDEPDAHLHVNLQREILDYFKLKSAELGVQFLIATHAEEFAKGVDSSQIISLLRHVPRRIKSTPPVLQAMAEVSNTEVTALQDSPVILYVEGESDERILRAWAKTCGAEKYLQKVCFRVMGGGDKKMMKDASERHFEALQQIIPDVRRLMLFDYDDRNSFHPPANNPVLYEWKRRNIENYLLVPDAWIRAALRVLDIREDELFASPIKESINGFFESENLTLPRGKNWVDLTANIFEMVDGKKVLFENDDSLFQLLRRNEPPVELIRETVTINMIKDEIHEDVYGFFKKIMEIVN